MAKLYFSVEADYQKVIRLREEIAKLEKQLRGFNSHSTADAIESVQNELRDLRSEYNRLTETAAKSGAELEKSSLSMGKALAAVGGVAALKSLGAEIIRVRGEFQEMETAIETLVGKSMSDKLIPQIKELAKVSPLTMTDIVGAEKMMLGFNIEADKTIGFLKALSDVSMGSSQKFNSLTLAFSQMSASGKLMGQDLNQMIDAGFNPLQQIALTTGKNIATLKEEMSKGAISAEMVQKAFIDATSAGGKFYKMSENASKTINGQISMLEDAWDSALNEMGKNSEDFIMKGIEATTSLVQNYEAVGRVIVFLVSTYGAYKAALLVNIALEKTQAVSRLASIKNVSLLSAATGVLTKKVALLNTVMKVNPYVLLATAVVGIGTAMWALADHTSEAEKGLAAYNREQEKSANIEADAKNRLEKLVSVLNDENASYGARQDAIRQMKASYTDLAAQFMDEKGHITDLTGLWEEYGRKALDAKIKAKETELSNLKMQYGSAEWSYKTNERLNNRSKMKQAKERMDFLAPQIDAYQKELEELRKQQLPKEEDTKSTYKEDLATAKKEWEDAKKELAKIEKDKGNYTSKQYKDAKNNVSTKEKAYKDLGGKTDKQLKKDEDAAKKEKENAQKLAEELLSIRRQNQQAEIDLMKEGSEKKEAQIELEYQKELDAIEKQRREWKDGQDGKLTDEQQASLGMMYVQAESKKDLQIAQVLKDEEMAMNEYLKEFGDFVDKRKATIELYNQQIEDATTKGEKLTLKKRMERELSEIDDAAQGTTSVIAQLFEDMSDKTIAEMQKIADEAENILKYVKSGTWVEKTNEKGEGTGKDEYGLTEAQFNTLKADPAKLKAIGDGVKDVKEKVKECRSVFEKTGEAFGKLFSGDGKFEEHLQTVISGVGKVAQSLDFLGNSLSAISDAFGGNFLGGLAEGIGVATEAANAAMSGAQAGAVFGPWGAAAGAAIGAVSSLAGSLSKLHDKKHERKIIQLQEQIEVLEKSYERLGESIEDAYSKDASNLIKDQNKLLEQQKVLIQQQIKEEENKKKTDNNRIKEWKEQIEEINKTIEDNKEAAIDAIFGSDLKSAIEDFTSAYVEAWSVGEDKAKSAKDVVKDMIKGMITESIKAAASDPMKAIREKLLAFWSDEYISGWEQDYLNKMATDLQKELDSKFGWADSFMGNDSAYSQEASSKGFEAMSQETGEELNGRFTALQIAGEETRAQVTLLNMTANDIKSIQVGIRDIATGIQDQLANSYLELVAINENTGATAKYLKDIKSDISEVKENTKNL